MFFFLPLPLLEKAELAALQGHGQSGTKSRMSLNHLFLQFLLPLLIEKMDSDLQSAKLDSLQTLVRRHPSLPSAHSWTVPVAANHSQAPLLYLAAKDSPFQSLACNFQDPS